MRFPLAFRPSASLRAVIERRASDVGVDSDGPAFAAWLGDLLAGAVSTAVAELVANEMAPHAATPPTEAEGVCLESSLPSSESGAIVPDSERKLGSGRDSA